MKNFKIKSVRLFVGHFIKMGSGQLALAAFCGFIACLPIILNLLGVSVDISRAAEDTREFVHTIFEATGIILGILGILLAMVYHRVRRNPAILIIALGYGWATTLDFYHLLAATHLTVRDDATFVGLTGGLSRSFTIFSTLIGIWITTRLAKESKLKIRLSAVLFIYSCLLATLAYTIIYLGAMSDSLKIYSLNSIVDRPIDGLPIVILGLIGFPLVIQFYFKNRTFFSFILLVGYLFQIESLAMQTFSSLFGANYYVLAHLFKVVAYGLPFAGICHEFVIAYKTAETMAARRFEVIESKLLIRQRQLEDEIIERLRAEQLVVDQNIRFAHSATLASLGEMAGGIAHEINTPLAIIKLTTSQLKEDLIQNQFDTLSALEMLTDVELTSEKISKIIRSLRTISRNGSKDAFTPTSIEKVFDEVSVLCEEKVKHKSIRLAMSVSPPDLLVMSREVELSQVVLNLVHNACDAVVALSERWIEVIADVKDTSVVVTITDSGSGIPEHLRDKILQPFFTTKEVGKGTGLGLSISKSIIEAHGGTLAIDTAHTNTRFVITLPILTIQNAQIA